MKMEDNTILITGGATGIGFALAESFVKLGNTVVVCGRRADKLDAAKKRLPALTVKQCDVSDEADRKALYAWVGENFKDLNVLVNNAGIQRRVDLTKGGEDLARKEDEIDINFKAQVHLAAMFVPMLSKQKQAAIVNVSSGLGFVPLTMFPIYSATKAAIHSFTKSLRHQLRGTSIKVFEVIPPTVHDTELKGKPIEKADWSVSSSEVAESVVKGMEADEYEIAIGASKRWVSSSKLELDQAFSNINQRD
ncbi:MAG: SDR family NAD(P)-dependent oxidoreductase [Thaumarchaeota archaeon]|nr:SDR family NAD(P)-dependent oxidoreductase [Nitrososphaerota archaeon]